MRRVLLAVQMFRVYRRAGYPLRYSLLLAWGISK